MVEVYGLNPMDPWLHLLSSFIPSPTGDGSAVTGVSDLIQARGYSAGGQS